MGEAASEADKKRTDVGKCTRLYDETQGTIKHKRFRQKVFVRCKKTDNNKRRMKQNMKMEEGVEVKKKKG